MPLMASRASSNPARKRTRPARRGHTDGLSLKHRDGSELVIITGLSGSGKASALKAFEDLGYYCVDNLPVELIPRFAELALQSGEIPRTALVVNVREGSQLEKLPAILKSIKRMLPTRVIYLEASESVLLRRFSETRRPHPLGTSTTVRASLKAERRHLRAIRAIADLVIDTSKFNVHELRAAPHGPVPASFQHAAEDACFLRQLWIQAWRARRRRPDVRRALPAESRISCRSSGPLTGKHPRVAKYIRSFPQTKEFISRISDLLVYLLPHYIHEGKSYLTISFGCTGGQHRSVMIAEDVGKHLRKAGYKVKVVHRDSPR